jgi:hypothetical protein
VRGWVALTAILGCSAVGEAQSVPSGPITTAGGRLTISGEASASFGTADPGYFNYSNYDSELTRQLRFDATAALRLGGHLTLLADLRLQGPLDGEGNWSIRPYAMFARFRPWTDRAFDVQAGLIPPVFGAFSRRAYGTDNPLVGYPLTYQYLTSLRSDALPASADNLLASRGHGWDTAYSVGSTAVTSGLPLVDGLRYPAGVEVRVGNRPLAVSVALTTGSQSSPRLTGFGAGRQLSAHVSAYPTTGLVLGASVSRGQYLTSAAVEAAAAQGPSGGAASGQDVQDAVGFDAEYSRGHWIVRAEGLFTRWALPRVRAPFIDSPISAFGLDAEARYRIRPGLYAAVRVGRLGFSDVTGSAGPAEWEAPVRRVEAGAGYSWVRNVTIKGAYQWNWRDTPSNRTEGLVSAQVIVAF